ncbi:hypothetical protein [Pseudovibrio sp. Ad46]|uniref:hypothetical protein n=1 Tax=Pseudovibrio sp. Ad46 TaxID=989432 RepID=UPI00187D30DD|nr:hypothetical protein [Pseudovibrio sp. Ad46]
MSPGVQSDCSQLINLNGYGSTYGDSYGRLLSKYHGNRKKVLELAYFARSKLWKPLQAGGLGALGWLSSLQVFFVTEDTQAIAFLFWVFVVAALVKSALISAQA